MENALRQTIVRQFSGLLAMIVVHGIFRYGIMMESWTWVNSGFIGTMIGVMVLMAYWGPYALFGYIPSFSGITMLVMMSDVSPWWATAIGLVVIQVVIHAYYKWESKDRANKAKEPQHLTIEEKYRKKLSK